MRFDIITIFPEMFTASPLDFSLIGKASDKGLIEVNIHNLRDWTDDNHKTTDDAPYGGGAGMVMKAPPIALACDDLRKKSVGARVALMTPQGRPLNHNLARELSGLPGLIVICGRYEGVDERVRELCSDYEISIGDYVLTGGEIPAMALVDCVARLVPGVVSKEESIANDSHADGLLEHPHYTRPPEYRGLAAPEVLLSGHHEKIEKWRREQSIIRTARRRPDLLEKAGLTDEERKMVTDILADK
ncbi:tRNA (guanine(37)-N(1))-methyltransferase [hydrothermal vent metagenome]|uniref:tRNA (guanine-N(1)-)-methyltransferase n=1 Tax=hydrothermal vent metagenome TaxID=652676 RepID=A0A3B1BSS3_9ZZZZ